LSRKRRGASHLLAVEEDAQLAPPGDDVEGVPLAHAARGELRGGALRVHRAGEVQRAVHPLVAAVHAPVVDLDFMARLPVRLAAGELGQGEAHEDARVVLQRGQAPVDEQLEVGELLGGVPEEAGAALGDEGVRARGH
jgi:hypothetical protein